ncbi:hypothetical protein ABAC460_20850 [Asticcacaulis sp. AC460]|uniref:hypothetical protein n=1 Tax=Asticcacaulis sp. AC460 TaxID=1282360 RepID=UPI0003C3EB04|nr:hypothetical protein [Asticcacaulis sp. AC460]ESQ87222.1 hypothetical protein ABAC460_20850 [Asticcacaulis sp. AC460]
MQAFKFIWPYSLGSLPFIGLFIYQIAVVWPTRPGQPDLTYTIPMHVGDRDVFISNMDLILMMGSWGIAAIIILIGYRRMRRQMRAR